MPPTRISDRNRLSLLNRRTLDGAVQARKAANAAQKVLKEARKLPAQVEALRKDGFSATTRNNWSQAAQNARNPQKALGFGHAMNAYGAVQGAVNFPRQALGTGRDVRAALRDPTRENVVTAVNSSIGLAKSGIGTVKSGLETARDVQRFGSAYRAASQGVSAAAPAVAPSVRRAASRAAARSAFSGTGARGVQWATRGATSGLSGPTARLVAKSAARGAAPAVARAAAGPVARAAGRFVPGANVAIAALDTAQFANDLRDPNAGTGKKIASGITALGSVAAATNIPVVSQVGAGVATVGSFVRGLFG